MKIIKRNGSEEVFDINKIIKAVKKADINSEERSLSDGQIHGTPAILMKLMKMWLQDAKDSCIIYSRKGTFQKKSKFPGK